MDKATQKHMMYCFLLSWYFWIISVVYLFITIPFIITEWCYNKHRKWSEDMNV
jgi:hypothetical protein